MSSVGMGSEPENRRQQLIKLCWACVYLLYLGYPVGDLTGGTHREPAVWLGGSGLAGFVGPYLFLLLSRRPRTSVVWWQWCILGWMFLLACVLSLILGAPWLMLFIYTSISAGVLLPARLAVWGVPLVSLTLLGLAEATHAGTWAIAGLFLPALLGGGAMMGVARMGRTMRELREARATVAQLAANEERLRLARDLHDLLGHSLSLITLKSELAGRMLPDRPEDAAKQVADIEQVSRQALVDVREAVSGFRRPTLGVELAGVRTALRTAGVEARIAPSLDRPPQERYPGLDADDEGALAWALREAVTNVVRHSGAKRCELALDEVWDTDESHYLRLEVVDDGHGPARGHRAGNGLGGLEERLLLSGGRLETGSPRHGGFSLRAYVPLRTVGGSEPNTVASPRS
jgi:two-component system sensor histidine kinase DesK